MGQTCRWPVMSQVRVAISAAQQAFHGRNHHADDCVGHKSIVNPIPGESHHQENVLRGQDLATSRTRTSGKNPRHGKNDSHGALWRSNHSWNL